MSRATNAKLSTAPSASRRGTQSTDTGTTVSPTATASSPRHDCPPSTCSTAVANVVLLAVALGDHDVGEVRASVRLERGEVLVARALHVGDAQVGCDDEHQVGAGLQRVDEAVDVGAGLDEVGDVGEGDDDAHRAGRAVLGDGLDADPHRRRAVAEAREVTGPVGGGERGLDDVVDHGRVDGRERGGPRRRVRRRGRRRAAPRAISFR